MVASVAAAIAHAAETDARDIEAGAAELGVFHAGDFTPGAAVQGEGSPRRRIEVRLLPRPEWEKLV